MMGEERKIIGLVERVVIKSPRGDREVLARIDTGATRSSIDLSLASELQLGPIIESTLIKNAHGSRVRPVIEIAVIIKGEEIKDSFTLSDRRHMRYKLLIGQNVLKKGRFIIDPLRSEKPKNNSPEDKSKLKNEEEK